MATQVKGQPLIYQEVKAAGVRCYRLFAKNGLIAPIHGGGRISPARIVSVYLGSLNIPCLPRRTDCKNTLNYQLKRSELLIECFFLEELIDWLLLFTRCSCRCCSCLELSSAEIEIYEASSKYIRCRCYSINIVVVSQLLSTILIDSLLEARPLPTCDRNRLLELYRIPHRLASWRSKE